MAGLGIAQLSARLTRNALRQAEPTLQDNNTCKTTATYTNLSCVSPPEQVDISWFVQSIDGIQDVDQIFTLNMVLNLRWRDWRLAYAEGGFGCWATSIQLAAMR